MSGITINNGDFGRKDNWGVRASVDNFDPDNLDFNPREEGFGSNKADANVTIGLGQTVFGGNPQIIGGGGDITMDPNSTIGDLLGNMNTQPKNNLANS